MGVTKLQNFTKGIIREFSAFPFSLHFVQTLSNLILNFSLMISHSTDMSM